MNELATALKTTIANLEERHSRLDAWLEGVHREQTPEENEADRKQLVYLQGQIDAYQTVLEHLTE